MTLANSISKISTISGNISSFDVFHWVSAIVNLLFIFCGSLMTSHLPIGMTIKATRTDTTTMHTINLSSLVTRWDMFFDGDVTTFNWWSWSEISCKYLDVHVNYCHEMLRLLYLVWKLIDKFPSEYFLLVFKPSWHLFVMSSCTMRFYACRMKQETIMFVIFFLL